MNIYLKALGCRLNEAELENWAEAFHAAGHAVVNEAREADITVLNTCAVTAEAVKKSRKLINRSRRDNPSAKLVVSGCFVSTGEATSSAELGVDMLVDNREKGKLVNSVLKRWQIPIMPEGATAPAEYSLFARNRQRAFIKIQDGCRYRCSYCIVTIARGAETSRPIAELVAEVNRLQASGVQEVVLTGVHVGGYGSDINSSLTSLVAALLSETDIPRIRFASVEPWDLGEGFFDLFDNARLMPHMHLPLQSGSDTLLRRMSRRCHTKDFENLLRQARESIPGFNVTTDIIVGFPGETEKLWQESLAFVERMQFGHIHIFSYSRRSGTKAATMPDQIDDATKRARSAQLHKIAAAQQISMLQRNTAQTVEVLWEKKASRGSVNEISGYTPNYLRVVANADPDTQTNQITRCELTSVDLERKVVIGRIVS